MAPHRQAEVPPSVTSKMRSSCNACTDAKIGCSKGRPTCARCARRKETCIYEPVRRAGRPALNKQKQHHQHQNHQRQVSSASENTGSTQTADAPLPPPPRPSSSTTCSLSAVRWPDDSVINHADSRNVFSTPMLTDASMDNFLPDGVLTTGIEDFVHSMSPISPLLVHQLNCPTMPSLFDGDGSGFEPNMFLLPGDVMQTVEDTNGCDPAKTSSACLSGAGISTANSGSQVTTSMEDDFFSNSTPFLPGSMTRSQTSTTLPSDVTSWFSSTHTRANSHRASAEDGLPSQQGSPQLLPASQSDSCGCLTRGLRLLSKLTPSNTRNGGSLPFLQRSFETVISQNRTTMDTINDIMSCPCSSDPSLLFVLALVVFKTLGWYAACASAVPGEKESKQRTIDDSDESQLDRLKRLSVQPPSSTTMPDYDFEDENQDRVICQLVLSELCGVQRTVNALSRQLQAWEKTPRRSAPSQGLVGSITQDLLYNGPMFNAAGSGGLAMSVERSLRYYLRTLCKAILNTLSES